VVGLIVIGLLAGLVCLVFFIIAIAKKRKKLWWVLGGGVSLLLFIIGVIGAMANTPTSSSSSLSNSTQTTTKTSAGNSSSGVVINYSLSTASQIGTGFSTSAPSAGDTYLIVSFNIVNNDSSSFNTNPNYFSVITNNIKYDYSWDSSNLDTELKTVDILKNGTLSGDLAFEVPANSTTFQLQYSGLDNFNVKWVKQ